MKDIIKLNFIYNPKYKVGDIFIDYNNEELVINYICLLSQFHKKMKSEQEYTIISKDTGKYKYVGVLESFLDKLKIHTEICNLPFKNKLEKIEE